MTDKEIIIKVFNLLNEKHFVFDEAQNIKDGRIESILTEQNIKDFLITICKENNLTFLDSKIREWFDVKINNCPFNIKITEGKSADNVSSKKGLCYAITGKLPKTVKHQETIDIISNFNINKDTDYGLIVYNKLKHKFYISSLKNLDEKWIVPNGNNLPFQVKFNMLDNKLKHSGSNPEKILIGKFYESWIKKLNVDISPLKNKLNSL